MKNEIKFENLQLGNWKKQKDSYVNIVKSNGKGLKWYLTQCVVNFEALCGCARAVNLFCKLYFRKIIKNISLFSLQTLKHEIQDLPGLFLVVKIHTLMIIILETSLLLLKKPIITKMPWLCSIPHGTQIVSGLSTY